MHVKTIRRTLTGQIHRVLRNQVIASKCLCWLTVRVSCLSSRYLDKVLEYAAPASGLTKNQGWLCPGVEHHTKEYSQPGWMCGIRNEALRRMNAQMYAEYMRRREEEKLPPPAAAAAAEATVAGDSPGAGSIGGASLRPPRLTLERTPDATQLLAGNTPMCAATPTNMMMGASNQAQNVPDLVHELWLEAKQTLQTKADDTARLRAILQKAESRTQRYQIIQGGWDKHSSSLLHIATRYSSMQCLKTLLDDPRRGDFIDVKETIYGNTPLHQAAWFNQPECLHILLKEGADPTIENNKGESPSQLATLRQRPDMAQVQFCIAHSTPTDLCTHTITVQNVTTWCI